MQRPHDWHMSADAPMDAPAMSIDAMQPPVYPVTSALGAVAAQRAAAVARNPHDAATQDPLALDPAPTADALSAVQVAAEAYEVLRRTGRELRFASAGGVMRIEVYDGSGHLVRSIPPNEALAL